MRPFKRAEEGATAVTIAVTIIVLLGFTALAVDGGVVYNERRSTHNAADHSALSAAWAACNDADVATAQAAGLTAALRNGYDDDADAIDVEIFHEGGNRYRAKVTAIRDTTFARLIGSDEVTVVSEAVADCDQASPFGGFALFAGAPASCDGEELSTPGATLEVTGKAHSNGDFHSPGPPFTKHYWGEVTYAEDGTLTGYAGQFHEGTDQTGFQDYPVPEYWVLDSYAPGGVQAAAAADVGSYFSFVGDQSWTSADIDTPGLYYVEGSVQLTNVDNDDVTIVATENIQFSGSSNRLTPYEDDGLLVFSGHDAPDPCGEQVAIHWAASSNTYTGVFYAPDGQCRLNNAASLGLDGSIICATINLAGAGVNITYNEDLGSGSFFTVELTE